jgi:YVTN family beta-propeller protein
VTVGKAPHEVEMLADGKTAAVSNYGVAKEAGRTLTLVDVEKGIAVATIELPEGARPHGLKALSDGRLLVTAEGLHEIYIVDPKARRLVLRIPTAREVSHMVAASPDAKRAYVANIGSGSVTVVDLAQGKVVKDVPTGGGAEGIAATPDGREVWVTNRAADTVSVLDTTTLAITATLPAAKFPIRVKITPDGKRALVSCAQSGDVAVFDTATKKEIKRISIGEAGKNQEPVGLLIAPDGKRAWVASTRADIVSVIDLDKLAIVGRVTAGKEPDGLAGVFGR